MTFSTRSGAAATGAEDEGAGVGSAGVDVGCLSMIRKI
jgi:hypothetical protein